MVALRVSWDEEAGVEAEETPSEEWVDFNSKVDAPQEDVVVIPVLHSTCEEYIHCISLSFLKANIQ